MKVVKLSINLYKLLQYLVGVGLLLILSFDVLSEGEKIVT